MYSARWHCVHRDCVRRSETWYCSIYFWNKIQFPPPPPLPTFLILKLFIKCLLVGVREGLGVGISLSYKWKQIGIFLEESSMSMNSLAWAYRVVGQTKPVGQYSLYSRAILAYYKKKWDKFCQFCGKFRNIWKIRGNFGMSEKFLDP